MNRPARGLTFVATGIISTLIVFGNCSAEETTAPAMPRQMLELKKHGTVDVTRDKAGKVTAIKLIVTSYQITLDEGSKPLEDMDGKKVRVLATYRKVDNEGWLKVSEVELLDAEKAAPATDKPETDKPEKKEDAKPAAEAPKPPKEEAKPATEAPKPPKEEAKPAEAPTKQP